MVVSLNGQPAELQRKEPAQPVTQDEHGNGESERRAAHEDAVHPSSVPPRREDAKLNRDDDGETDRAQRESDRRLQPLCDQRGHGLLAKVRAAKIAAHDVSEPDHELRREWTIESE